MLEQHIAFLASQNIDTAHQLHEKIMEAVKSLVTFPERYPLFEHHNLTFQFRKMFIPNWYITK